MVRPDGLIHQFKDCQPYDVVPLIFLLLQRLIRSILNPLVDYGNVSTGHARLKRPNGADYSQQKTPTILRTIAMSQ